MRHVVEVDEVHRLIVIRVSGRVTIASILPVALQERLLAQELGFGVIFDYRRAHFEIAYSEAFYWLDRHYNTIDPTLKQIRTAHLASPENLEFLQFLELSWSNRGARVRVFEDEDEAVRWLARQAKIGSASPSLREALVDR